MPSAIEMANSRSGKDRVCPPAAPTAMLRPGDDAELNGAQADEDDRRAETDKSRGEKADQHQCIVSIGETDYSLGSPHAAQTAFRLRRTRRPVLQSGSSATPALPFAF